MSAVFDTSAMKVTAQLTMVDETKNYVKYEIDGDEDDGIAAFNTIYIPSEDVTDAPEEVTITIEDN